MNAHQDLHVMPMSPSWASAESARASRQHAFQVCALLRTDVDRVGNVPIEVIAGTAQYGTAGENTLVSCEAPQPQSP